MIKITQESLGVEEDYNYDGYADHLENEHFHHSDKGCKCEMFVRYGTRKGEVSLPMVAKRCLTHNVECHKEGFEIGFMGGTDSSKIYCQDCGCEIKGGTTATRCAFCQKKFNTSKCQEWAVNNKEYLKQKRKEKRHQNFLDTHGRYED